MSDHEQSYDVDEHGTDVAEQEEQSGAGDRRHSAVPGPDETWRHDVNDVVAASRNHSDVVAAATKLATAYAKQNDAGGKVRVREAEQDQVLANRQSTTVQRVAAEEAVQSAVRAWHLCSDAVARAWGVLRQVAQEAADAGEDRAEPEEDKQAPQLRWSTLPEFVEWVSVTYRRKTESSDLNWCPEWWKHPEAVARLTGMWKACEHLRIDPATGPSVMWRDHIDHHMAALMSSDGTFANCGPSTSKDRGHSAREDQRVLPVLPAPEQLYAVQPPDLSAHATNA